MAARVNKKFVIILTSSLLVVFMLVAAAGFYAYSSRAQRNLAKGDAAFDAGNYYEAKVYYGRAVSKDNTNIEWLEKYHDALLRSTPPTRAEYDKFYEDHIRAMQKMALLKERDIDHQIEYVEKRDRAIRRTNPSLNGYKQIERLVDEAARYIRDDEPKLAILNRYRALATVERMQSEVVEESEKSRARRELEEAIEFNPDDDMAKLGLASWDFAEVSFHRRNRQPDNAQTAFARGMTKLDDFLAENPGHAGAHLMKLRVNYEEGLRRAVSPLERTRLVDRLIPMYGSTVDVFAASDPEDLRIIDIQILFEIGKLLNADKKEELVQIVDGAREVNENDIRLLELKGDVLASMRRFEDATEVYQEIVDAPLPPVSLEGRILPVYRREALANQIDVALVQYETASSADAKAEAIERAREYRDKLAEIITVQDRDKLSLREAKIALVDEDYQIAVQKFTEIIKAGEGDVAQNHFLLAYALEQLGNLGEARNVMLDLLQIVPGSPQLLTRVAEYDIKFGDFDTALGRLEEALEGDPSSEMIQQRIREVKTAIDPESEGADPLVAMVIKSRKLRDEKQFTEAEAMLRDGLRQYPNEYRLVRELAEVLDKQDRRDDALALIDGAIAANPGNTNLQQVRIVIEEDDPVARGIKLIDLSSASETDKLIDKYQVYARNKLPEEAERVLAEARGIDPLNERLIDLEFLIALSERDEATAQRVVDRATDANADQVGGKLFSARYELVFGDPRKAIEILEEVTIEAPRKPAAWLLLGEARMSGGRVEQAVEAFAKAHEGRPTDTQIIKAYARGLIRTNRESEALELITPGPGLARSTMSDPELVEMWLRLAETYGDRDEVLRMRGQLFASEPGVFNFRNAIDYFRMLINDENWEEAESVLASLDSLETMSDLQIHVLRVNLVEARDGLDPAIDLFEQYVANLETGDEETLVARLNLGEFFLNRGMGEEAAAAFEAAREHQTDLLEADRKLGDFFFNSGSRQQALSDNATSRNQQQEAAEFKQRAMADLEKAAEYYKNIIDSGTLSDTGRDQVIKRSSETLLKLGRTDEAKAAVAMIDQDDRDLETLVLSASIATAEGDRRRARGIYDEAVERFPDQTLPYIQRALFNASNPELLPDAISDLQRAVVLDPSRIQAWVKLYELRRSMGDLDAAFADLRRSIDANPSEDTLQRLLISELFSAGRREEGLIAALEAVRARPENEQWLTAVAQILARSERYREASDLFRRLIDLDKGETPNPNYIAGLLDMTLLRTDTDIPDTRIFELLRDFRAVADPNSVYHLMLESRALTEVGEVDAAFEKLKDALLATGQSGASGALWFQQLQYVTVQREKSYTFIDQVDNNRELNPFIAVQLQNYKSNEGEPLSPLVDRLNQILDAEPDLITRLEALKKKSQFLYRLGEYEKSAEAIKQALEITPTDAELNNNLAFIYVDHLENYDLGVKHAELALARNARSSSTLDTLGWAYYHTDRIDEARDKLRSAIDLAQTDAEQVAARIHLGFVEVKSGEDQRARREYEQALQLLENSRELTLQYQDKIEALRMAIQ